VRVIGTSGSGSEMRQTEERTRLIGDVLEVDQAAASRITSRRSHARRRGVGHLPAGPFTDSLSGRTSSAPACCGHRPPASSASRRPARVVAAHRSASRARRWASSDASWRGITRPPARRCAQPIMVEHLREHPAPFAISRHEHAQLPGDDLARKRRRRAGVAHRVGEADSSMR